MTDRKPPNQWQVRRFADVGTSEEFVREMLYLPDILDGTLIMGEERKQANSSILDVLTGGLVPAFLVLKKIRQSVGQELPIVDHQQMYEDFGGKLWKAYKELMQQAAKDIGFEIGFLFQRDPSFENGLVGFRQKNSTAPGSLEDYLRNVRRSWHTDLANFRNTIIEHPSGDRSQFQKFYDPRFAENLFTEVWHTIVEILAMLLELRLPTRIHLEWQDRNAPEPRWEKRYRFVIDAPLPKS
jgi:hypothetical protein